MSHPTKCLILENGTFRAELDRQSGGLCAVTNKLTGETYAVTGDAFAVEIHQEYPASGRREIVIPPARPNP